MRLGIAKLENCVFYLPLHSAFAIFAEILIRHANSHHFTINNQFSFRAGTT